MIVAIAPVVRLDRRGDILVAIEIIRFGEFRQRIERGRRVVGQIVMQGAQPRAGGDRLGHRGIVTQIPDRIEIMRCGDLGPAFPHAREIVQVAADRIGLHALVRIKACTIHRRIEQNVADAAFAAAMLQEMIVAVDIAVGGQHLVAQIRIALAIPRLLEQPVRRAEAEPGAAIGVEPQLRMAIAHRRGGARMRLQVPGFVEPDVRRMTTRLTVFEIEPQYRRIVGVAEFDARIGIGGEIPRRIEHRPGYRRLPRQLQHLAHAGSAVSGMLPLLGFAGSAATCGVRSAARRRVAAPRSRPPCSRAAPAPRRHPVRTSAAAAACRPACGAA